MIRGMDVSEAQGFLDDAFWQAAVDAGIKFVYVRVSYGDGHEDSQFRHNVERAHAYGLKVGGYHYDYSIDPDTTYTHGEKCRAIIDDAGVLLELPVFYDLEDADGWKARHGYDFCGVTATRQVQMFVEGLKLNSGVYASYSWLEQGMSGDGRPIAWRNMGYPVWNAQWSDTDDIQGYVWQDCDNLEIGGHAVDGDWMYDDALFAA